jgi:uncharacterized protein (DUF1330 family)
MTTKAPPAVPPATTPAYLIVDVTAIHDEPTYASYRAAVPATIAAAGGRYLARGGTISVLEGDWQPGRLVVVQFPDPASAIGWWGSASYAPLRELRTASISANMVVVAGLAGEPGR